jgi:alpha-tubulin suppressor-like RCC1 family protein
VLDCWGRNSYGQLGDNTITTRLAPVQVSGITNGTQVSAGGGTGGNTYEHSCALLSTGAVDCWGYNAYGELGNGTLTDSHIPVVTLLQ